MWFTLLHGSRDYWESKVWCQGDERYNWNQILIANICYCFVHKDMNHIVDAGWFMECWSNFVSTSDWEATIWWKYSISGFEKEQSVFLLVNSHVSFFFSYHNFLLQLFQNILASTELYFPPEALEELHSDCLDLCRNLLRQNPGIHCNFMSWTYMYF